MFGVIVATIFLFIVACALCVAINYVAFRYWLYGAPTWLKYITFVVLVTAIFVMVYYISMSSWGWK